MASRLDQIAPLGSVAARIANAATWFGSRPIRGLPPPSRCRFRCIATF